MTLKDKTKEVRFAHRGCSHFSSVDTLTEEQKYERHRSDLNRESQGELVLSRRFVDFETSALPGYATVAY